jgi:hypothetical protein
MPTAISAKLACAPRFWALVDEHRIDDAAYLRTALLVIPRRGNKDEAGGLAETDNDRFDDTGR